MQSCRHFGIMLLCNTWQTGRCSVFPIRACAAHLCGLWESLVKQAWCNQMILMHLTSRTHSVCSDGTPALAAQVDGYAPFCKHVFVPNFVGRCCGRGAVAGRSPKPYCCIAFAAAASRGTKHSLDTVRDVRMSTRAPHLSQRGVQMAAAQQLGTCMHALVAPLPALTANQVRGAATGDCIARH